MRDGHKLKYICVVVYQVMDGLVEHAYIWPKIQHGCTPHVYVYVQHAGPGAVCVRTSSRRSLERMYT